MRAMTPRSTSWRRGSARWKVRSRKSDGASAACRTSPCRPACGRAPASSASRRRCTTNEDITPKPPTKDYPTDATEEELDTYSQFFKWTNKPADPDDEANNGFGLVDRETGEGWDTNITWFQYFSKPDAYSDYVPSSSLAAGL